MVEIQVDSDDYIVKVVVSKATYFYDKQYYLVISKLEFIT
jgi:hypothetical protein